MEVGNADGNGAVVQYKYDAQNQLIAKLKFDSGDTTSTPDKEQYFIYDLGQIVLQFDGDEASDLSHRYLWGPAVDQILADEDVNGNPTTAGDVVWPLADHLGTVHDIVALDPNDDTLTVTLNHFVYDGFGNVIDEMSSSVDHLFGYTGRMFDEDTGLQNNLHRWYEAATGTWISQDPIGFEAGDANLYRYVENGPTNAVDPKGLEFVIPTLSGDGTATYTPGPASLIPIIIMQPPLEPDWSFLYEEPSCRVHDDGVVRCLWDDGFTTVPDKPFLEPYKWEEIDWIGSPSSGSLAIQAIGQAPFLRCGVKSPFRLSRPTSAPRRVINQIGDLSPAESRALKSIWEGGPRSALPLETREALAAYYRSVGARLRPDGTPINPPGFAQRAFQEARARYLLGQGPNPGRNAHEFGRLNGIPIFRRGAGQ